MIRIITKIFKYGPLDAADALDVSFWNGKLIMYSY